MRAFVSIGTGIRAMSTSILLLGFDGTHSKNAKYRGTVLTLIGMGGNGATVTIAFAVVHAENKPNIMWFFQHCVKTGVVFSGVPVFCDRGSIIPAAKELHAHDNILLNLEFCTIHLLRNIKKNFNLTGQAIENAVWAVQGSESTARYEQNILAVRDIYGDACAEYIKGIDPVQWTVFANMRTSSRSINPAFTKTPLFRWRSTNFVESDNNTMLISGLRHSSPLDMLKKAMPTAMEGARKRNKLLATWEKRGLQLTHYAHRL